jgi:hypothetical protein
MQGPIGPTGPTGATGAQGPTGPTGATGTEPGTALIEAIWVTGGLSNLANKSPVPFDNIREVKGAISYTLGSGAFTINETGYYLINWWVTTNGASPATTINFNLLLNGIIQSQAASPDVIGQVVGTALHRVTTVPSIISVVNDTGANVSIPQAPCQADITIVRVSSLP